jgi:LIM domain kinase 1
MRGHRAQSVPASDARADYIKCFRLSDLEIGELIGKGFYGNVLKVTHRHTRQIMVMKEMSNCTNDAKVTFMKEVGVVGHVIVT